MFNKKTIHDIKDVKGKTVLVRADFNVPINELGVITDDFRIRQALPTIEHLRAKGAKIVLISHLGRPSGPGDSSASLLPVSKKLQHLLHLPVQFVDDCVGQKPQEVVAKMSEGDILLLENLRFHKEEEQNNREFAQQLAQLADVFVQDGFGVVHRAHASTKAITEFLPSYAGFLLEKEVSFITKALEDPDRPLAVVIGGAKISDKIELLTTLIKKADFVAVVGVMANTFLLAEGVQVGASLVEKDSVSTARSILKEAKMRATKEPFTFYLPEDVVVANKIDSKSHTRVVDISHHTWADINAYPTQPKKEAYTVASDELILDIGPISAGYIAGALSQARTAIWNGTAGVTEVEGWHSASRPFSHGTKTISTALVSSVAGAKNHPFTIVGGGDTVGYVESVDGLRERLDLVSTGGGASLDLMVGKKLPGIEALQNK